MQKKLVSTRPTVRKFRHGLLNTLINKLPGELHIPGYRFRGPGTKLKERLLRSDTGINPLDEPCKLHDITFSQAANISERYKAVKVLQEATLK